MVKTASPEAIEEILEKRKIQLILKRIFDIIVSFIGLLVLLPIFMIIAFIIKVDSKGPIFFRQIRIGKKMVKKV